MRSLNSGELPGFCTVSFTGAIRHNRFWSVVIVVVVLLLIGINTGQWLPVTLWESGKLYCKSLAENQLIFKSFIHSFIQLTMANRAFTWKTTH